MTKDGKRGSNYYSIRTKVSGNVITITVTKTGEDTEFSDIENIVVQSQILKEIAMKRKVKQEVALEDISND